MFKIRRSVVFFTLLVLVHAVNVKKARDRQSVVVFRIDPKCLLTFSEWEWCWWLKKQTMSIRRDTRCGKLVSRLFCHEGLRDLAQKQFR